MIQESVEALDLFQVLGKGTLVLQHEARIPMWSWGKVVRLNKENRSSRRRKEMCLERLGRERCFLGSARMQN
jgi:hypothetical protein